MNKYEKIFSVKNLKIFVFGGCGLIGSEISKSLIDLEARVTVFDIQLNKNTKKNSFKFVKLSN